MKEFYVRNKCLLTVAYFFTTNPICNYLMLFGCNCIEVHVKLDIALCHVKTVVFTFKTHRNKYFYVNSYFPC